MSTMFWIIYGTGAVAMFIFSAVCRNNMTESEFEVAAFSMIVFTIFWPVLLVLLPFIGVAYVLSLFHKWVGKVVASMIEKPTPTSGVDEEEEIRFHSERD